MIAKVSQHAAELETLPVIPMRGMMVFPDTVNHFDVGRPKTIAAIDSALKSGGKVFIVAQRDITVDEPDASDLYRYGVVAEVKQALKFSDNFLKVLVECGHRAKLMQLYRDKEYLYADVIDAPVKSLKASDMDNADALVRSIRDQLDSYMDFFPKLANDVMLEAFGNKSYNKFLETIANNLPFDYAEKQKILEEQDIIKRLQLLLSIMIRENNVLDIEKEISDKVHDQMDKNQREYYLREQMKVIATELGDNPDIADEGMEYREKIRALPIEPENIKKLEKEVDRLMQMPGNSQEASVIRTYLDTVIDLPWNTSTTDKFNLAAAQKILDREHYGLEKVKERILEYIAVRSLTDKINAQIICLVGPPGVGKTSIAKAVAECLGRKFVRMSLGGVRDEAEIRGHRRTYVASMPGRIINAIQQAGTNNPLVLLDEIDKLGNDFRGDPASALLEVLDPEQNKTFRDHFIDMPFDLSKVMFITTANNESTIPEPLLDRMEKIELSSYTRLEKFKIAKLHLIKKQIAANGLTKEQFSITDKALYTIIDDYNRESGVRSLERSLAKLIRKSAKMIVAGEKESVKVDTSNIESMLGPRIIRNNSNVHKSQVGVANGLAWTSVGGVMMPIETVVIRGNGKIEATGSLGDVMKESAKLAVTCARTLPKEYGVPENLVSEYDIHIHAPEGAVPKDGPSAGVTLTLSLVSAVSGVPVKPDIAMTGEITLKGNVLAIGGLKEKLIAAHEEKMKIVLIPRDNLQDLAEISNEVTEGLEIIPVDTVLDVLNIALDKPDKPEKRIRTVTPKAKNEVTVNA